MSEFQPDTPTILETEAATPKLAVKPLHLTALAAGIILLLGLLVLLTGLPPKDFPVNKPFTINRGLSASAITKELKTAGIVRSQSLLYFALTLWHDPGAVKAGTYVFAEPLSVWQLADRLTEDAPPDTLIALTFPEGFSVRDYAMIAKDSLVDFNEEKFTALAEDREGYLFPDTYYVPPDFTEAELFALLTDTYEEKLTALNELVAETDLSESDVIILASVVEREANTPESMSLVAGILLNRLSIGMALQADATLEYVLNKPLNELTPEDLEIDSPYNTYLYPGLPPTPIGNPGLQSIEAVIHPTSTEYFYYITDADGTFHYAETFEQHKINIADHLR